MGCFWNGKNWEEANQIKYHSQKSYFNKKGLMIDVVKKWQYEFTSNLHDSKQESMLQH